MNTAESCRTSVSLPPMGTKMGILELAKDNRLELRAFGVFEAKTTSARPAQDPGEGRCTGQVQSHVQAGAVDERRDERESQRTESRLGMRSNGFIYPQVNLLALPRRASSLSVTP